MGIVRFLLAGAFASGFLACSAGGSGVTTSDGGGGNGADAGLADVDAGNASDAALDASAITQDETWDDGKRLNDSVRIALGVTVTIAPGAKIAVGPGVAIVVEGTLRAKSAAAHARLSGSAWVGIVVAAGGTLALQGVDIAGPDAAVHALGGNASATYDDATISGATNPFIVEAGGRVSTSHASVTNPGGRTTVNGSFTASYLSYDPNDNYGIYAMHPAATVTIDDSTFQNTGPRGAAGGHDLINAYGAASIHVAYTILAASHCGLHFEAVDSVDIDHVTIQNVSNGADLWGSSSVGTRRITSSNFESARVGLDESGANGVIDVVGCYCQPANNLAGGQVKVTGSVAQPVAGAGPR